MSRRAHQETRMIRIVADRIASRTANAYIGRHRRGRPSIVAVLRGADRDAGPGAQPASGR